MIYGGPGSASFTSAAASWADISSAYASAASTMTALSASLASEWTGPSASAASGVLNTYTSWLTSASATAQTTSQMAAKASALFEAARAASVPPPVIAENRAQLLMLIATNILGQNTPAIAATEAQYEAMWAQDGGTMDAYAAASAANSQTSQPVSPAPDTSHAMMTQASPAAPPADPSSVAHSAAATSTPSPLSAGTATDSGTSALSSLSPVASMATVPLRIMMSMITSLARLGSVGSSAASTAGQSAAVGGAVSPEMLLARVGQLVDGKLQSASGTLVGHFRSATDALSARMAQAAQIGQLKVPSAWAQAAGGMVRAAPILPSTTVSAPVSLTGASQPWMSNPFNSAMMGAMAGRGMGSIGAKIPKIMPRHASGG